MDEVRRFGDCGFRRKLLNKRNLTEVIKSEVVLSLEYTELEKY